MPRPSLNENGSNSTFARCQKKTFHKKLPVLDVTQERAHAQRIKVENQRAAKQVQESERPMPSPTASTKKKSSTQGRKRMQGTMTDAFNLYISDHIGGNWSDQTIEWHQSALKPFIAYLADHNEFIISIQ